jgi:hypothetical protein
MALIRPEACPGHRFPTRAQIARYRPGRPIFCVWCNLQVGVKEDPRAAMGARFLSRWRPMVHDSRLS